MNDNVRQPVLMAFVAADARDEKGLALHVVRKRVLRGILSAALLRAAIRELVEYGFLSDSASDPDWFSLSQRGRDFVAKRYEAQSRGKLTAYTVRPGGPDFPVAGEDFKRALRRHFTIRVACYIMPVIAILLAIYLWRYWHPTGGA